MVLCTIDQQESCSYKALILALFLNNFLPKTECLWIYHDIVYIFGGNDLNSHDTSFMTPFETTWINENKLCLHSL